MFFFFDYVKKFKSLILRNWNYQEIKSYVMRGVERAAIEETEEEVCLS